MRTAVFGLEVSNFKDGEDEYDIFIRLEEKYRNDVSTLMNQKIPINDNKIPISSVAKFKFSSSSVLEQYALGSGHQRAGGSTNDPGGYRCSGSRRYHQCDCWYIHREC